MLPKEALPQVRVKMVEEEVLVEATLRVPQLKKVSDLLLGAKAEKDVRATAPTEALDQEVKTEVMATAIVTPKVVVMVLKEATDLLLDQRVLNQVADMATVKIREVMERVSSVATVVDTHLGIEVVSGIRVVIATEREETIKQKSMNQCSLKRLSLL